MASTEPPPAPGDTAPQDPRWQPSLRDPYLADPQRADRAAYTATDAGAGITTDSLQAWQNHRAEFGTFVRGDVTGVAGSAGPAYTCRPGATPVAPNLVLTDDTAGSWP